MKKRRILVVDDSTSTADTLALFFELEGFEVRTAYGGVEALSGFKEFAPSLVFLDISMPRMDGYEVARFIRESVAAEDAILVALTGHHQDEVLLKTQEAGFQHLLTKPTEPSDLRDLLARVEAQLAK